eukprot:2085896-Heterocapsa_arctica.AAC.1
MPLLAEAWSLKRPRGRSRAAQYEELVKSLDEAMAARTRAENNPASIGDRGFAVDASLDILDDRNSVVAAWANVKRIVYNDSGYARYGAGAADLATLLDHMWPTAVGVG